jgi:hypothetical protein
MIKAAQPQEPVTPPSHKGLVARLLGFWLLHKLLGKNE